MGLDSVELVMRIEDDFRIVISDEEASRIRTVAQMADLVLSKVRHGADEPCPSQHAFYVVRRILMAEAGARRSSIKPESELRDLIASRDRRRVWPRVLNSVTGSPKSWPRLVHPIWFSLSVVLIPPIATFTYLAFIAQSALAFILPLCVAVACIPLTNLGTPLRRNFPRRCAKVKDLVRFAKSLDSKTWSEGEVLEKVREITADELRLPVSTVTSQSDFVRDLGL